jgi:hypothetical protein
LKKHISEEARKDIKSLTIDLFTDVKKGQKRDAKKEVNKKEPSPTPKPIKRVSNLKDYGRQSPNTNTPNTTKKAKRVSKMQQDVQSYIKKCQQQSYKWDQKDLLTDNDLDESSEELAFPAEKPDKEIPVPYKYHPGYRRLSKEFEVDEEDWKITKSESHIDSKANTNDSFTFTKKPTDDNERHREPTSSASHPHFASESEITVNKSDPEEHESLPTEIFQNDSPDVWRKTDSDFDNNEEDEEYNETPEPIKLAPKQEQQEPYIPESKKNICKIEVIRPEKIAEKFDGELLIGKLISKTKDDTTNSQKWIPRMDMVTKEDNLKLSADKENQVNRSLIF